MSDEEGEFIEDEAEGLRLVAEAARFLVPVAEHSVQAHGWDPVVVRWLHAVAARASGASSPLQ